MRQERPPRPKPGDPVTAKWANDLIDHIERNAVTAGPGLISRQSTKGGTVLSTTGTTSQQLAITDGTVSACVPNTGSCLDVGMAAAFQPGTGNVNFVNYTQTCWLEDLSGAVPVLNFSTTTGGIPDGTLVWLSQDASGNWVITAVDCGN